MKLALFFRPLSSTLSNFTTDELLSSSPFESSSDYESMLMFSSGLMLCSYPNHLTMLSQFLNDPNLVHFINALCLVRKETPAMVVRLIQLPPPLLSHFADGHLDFLSSLWVAVPRNGRDIHWVETISTEFFRLSSVVHLYYYMYQPGPTTHIFSFLSRIVLNERTYQSLPRRLEHHTDPILHPSDRIIILPCRNMN